MGEIQKALVQSFDILPKAILRKLLARKVKEAGVVMPPDMIDAFADHLLSKDGGDFVWDAAPDGHGKNLKLQITDDDHREIDAAIASALEVIPEVVSNISKEAADEIFEELRENWAIEGAVQRYDLEGFRDRMEERWGEGLDYLRMLLTCCREVGRETSRRHNKSKSKRHMFRRWVLVRLHTRACQVTDEIISLMENGFADGAMARWRTLHEISVVAALIADGDEDLAERYILHDAVEVKRQADEHEATQVPLGFAPIKKRERLAIEAQYAAVIDRFGSAFRHPYGWAAQHLDHKQPTFKQLQIAAGRAGMSGYYKMASFNVHAGARSMFFNLSSMGDSDILLAGRSNAGLVEPGERAAQTLLLITSLYVGDNLDLDKLMELNSLLRIRDAVTPSLMRAERRLERDEKARQKDLAAKRAKRAEKRSPR